MAKEVKEFRRSGRSSFTFVEGVAGIQLVDLVQIWSVVRAEVESRKEPEIFELVSLFVTYSSCLGFNQLLEKLTRAQQAFIIIELLVLLKWPVSINSIFIN